VNEAHTSRSETPLSHGLLERVLGGSAGPLGREGAEVNEAHTWRSQTPLSIALSRNHPEVAALLREAGAQE
jgi:hypothetical protein